MIRRRWIIIAFLLTIILFLISSIQGHMNSALAYTFSISATPLATATPTSPGAPITIYTTLLAGIIGGACAVIAALIAGIFIVYQTRQSAKLQHNVMLMQAELEKKTKTTEQDEQRKEADAEKLRIASLLAKTTAERVAFYRQAIHADPRISSLQILSMSRPLEVANVYIRVRLHEQARPGYLLDSSMLGAESKRDPNSLLKAGQKYLESKVSSALDPDEAIRRYKHCILVGDPGAGKTTLLKFLTLKSVDNQLKDLPDLPIHIGLNDFVNSKQQDLLGFAALTWEERYGFPKEDARAYMIDKLKKGQALLLLDALDETVTGTNSEEAEASYKRVSDDIVSLKTRYSQTPIVVTARKAGYHARGSLAGFTELEVLDFRQEDIEQFICKWFANQQDKATDLNDRLKRNPRIQALAANPLLLSLIALVYEAQLDLPDRRAELYKRCVDILLTEWDSTRNIQRRRDFKPEYKRQLLEEIAWHFHLQGLRYFPDDELRQVIAEFLPTGNIPAEQSGDILKEIANENGLLKEQAQGWHGVLHLTLQKYFVALYAVEHNELETLLTYRDDSWWEEVLLLYAGQIPDASPLFVRLLGRGDGEPLREDIFYTNLILAGRCLTARPRIREVSLRDEVTSRLFTVLETSTYIPTVEKVANVLVGVGGADIINKMLLNLRPSNRDWYEGSKYIMQWTVAEAFGASGERSVIPELLKVLRDESKDHYVRQKLVSALGALGEGSVVPDLRKLLLDEKKDKDVRRSAVSALGALGEGSVVPDLRKLLLDERTDKDVRQGAASALAALGERSVIPDLRKLLLDEKIDKAIYASVVSALGALGEQSIVPEALKFLNMYNNDVMVYDPPMNTVCNVLSRIADDKAAVIALASLYKSDNDDLSYSLSSQRVPEALWHVSRRARMRVYEIDSPTGKQLEVVKIR